MYVTGRADTGPGTILASLCESSRALPLEKVTIAATNPDNAAVVDKAAQRLNERLGTSLEVDYHVVESDPAAAVKMLADQASYDAVIISVPDHLHYAYAKATLEAGMHTMLVKPFVETLREAKELTALTTEKSALLWWSFTSASTRPTDTPKGSYKLERSATLCMRLCGTANASTYQRRSFAVGRSAPTSSSTLLSITWISCPF